MSSSVIKLMPPTKILQDGPATGCVGVGLRARMCSSVYVNFFAQEHVSLAFCISMALCALVSTFSFTLLEPVSQPAKS